MSLSYESSQREPLVTGAKSYTQVTDDICRVMDRRPSRAWYVAMGLASLLLLWGCYAVYHLIVYGIGTWNLGKTIGWGWDITNYIWWIGVAQGGTLISAILLLFRQDWRTGVNRAAEGMTILAIMCAGLYPLLHMGRLWDGFFVFPYPNTRGVLWTNFHSPLLWDAIAVFTYLTVSIFFWYISLVPDLATIRDRARTRIRKIIYGIASFGWTGSVRQWQQYEFLALAIAGISMPLVFSVHSIVSFDFATSVIPGWHTTIFPPYFVTGAIFSGFAMVQTLVIVTRKVLGWEDYITLGHIEAMNKVILLTGSILGCAYLTELFMAWYGANPYEYEVFYKFKLQGPYAWSYWTMMSCNVIAPQFFWFRSLRRNVYITFILSIAVNVGMWFERFVIIVSSLYRDYLPSSWSLYYTPTIWEWALFLGTVGLFFVCYLLFVRILPSVAIAEVKSVLTKSSDEANERAKNLEEESLAEFMQKNEHK